jgi:NADPH:quinone reductase-like Zn-dependent oxidoreductase
MLGNKTLVDHASLAISLQTSFGVDHLCMKAADRAILPAGHVGIQLSHSALNYRDLLMVEGQYNPRQPLPLIPCSDGVGVIDEVNATSPWQVGQRVIPTFSQSWLDGEPTRQLTQSTLGGPLDGTLRRYAHFAEDGLVSVPTYLTDAEASTLGCAALTAWSALIELGQLSAGSHVLCIGTGGVSLFAAQIAAISGARVTLISRHQYKLDMVMNHPNIQSFSHLITPIHTPTNQPWGKQVKQMTGAVDHVVEVGGAGTLKESIISVRPGGTISLIGVLSGGGGALNLTPVLMRQIKIQGVIVGHKAGCERMLKAFETHQLRPILSTQRFNLHEADQAFRYLQSAQHVGKIVITH